MITPTVTEIASHLEPITIDPFIANATPLAADQKSDARGPARRVRLGRPGQRRRYASAVSRHV